MEHCRSCIHCSAWQYGYQGQERELLVPGIAAGNATWLLVVDREPLVPIYFVTLITLRLLAFFF